MKPFKRLGEKVELSKSFSRKSEKRLSMQQEERISKELGGRRMIGSGAFPGLPGDVIHPDYLFELKRTKRKSFYLSFDILEKAEREATLFKRNFGVIITFESFVDKPNDWITQPDPLPFGKKYKGKKGITISEKRIDEIMLCDERCAVLSLDSIDRELYICSLERFKEWFNVR